MAHLNLSSSSAYSLRGLDGDEPCDGGIDNLPPPPLLSVLTSWPLGELASRAPPRRRHHGSQLLPSSGSTPILAGRRHRASRVTHSIDESLAHLGLKYVDILHCHDIEFTNLDQIVNEMIHALQKIKESVKARFIGITGLALSIFTYVLDRVPPGSVHLIMSYRHYGINDIALVNLLPYLKSKGVGVISASPLAMGLLTDNGPPECHPAPEELKLANLTAKRFTRLLHTC